MQKPTITIPHTDDLKLRLDDLAIYHPYDQKFFSQKAFEMIYPEECDSLYDLLECDEFYEHLDEETAAVFSALRNRSSRAGRALAKSAKKQISRAGASLKEGANVLKAKAQLLAEGVDVTFIPETNTSPDRVVMLMPASSAPWKTWDLEDKTLFLRKVEIMRDSHSGKGVAARALLYVTDDKKAPPKDSLPYTLLIPSDVVDHTGKRRALDSKAWKIAMGNGSEAFSPQQIEFPDFDSVISSVSKSLSTVRKYARIAGKKNSEVLDKIFANVLKMQDPRVVLDRQLKGESQFMTGPTPQSPPSPPPSPPGSRSMSRQSSFNSGIQGEREESEESEESEEIERLTQELEECKKHQRQLFDSQCNNQYEHFSEDNPAEPSTPVLDDNPAEPSTPVLDDNPAEPSTPVLDDNPAEPSTPVLTPPPLTVNAPPPPPPPPPSSQPAQNQTQVDDRSQLLAAIRARKPKEFKETNVNERPTRPTRTLSPIEEAMKKAMAERRKIINQDGSDIENSDNEGDEFNSAFDPNYKYVYSTHANIAQLYHEEVYAFASNLHEFLFRADMYHPGDEESKRVLEGILAK